MKVKVLEIRDDGTFIPTLAVDMNPDVSAVAGSMEDFRANRVKLEAQRYLLRRCGYPCDQRPNIAVTRLSCDGDPCSNDPYHWRGRTWPVAHAYIIEHWDSLRDGDVIDVQYILGETSAPKRSERETIPL